MPLKPTSVDRAKFEAGLIELVLEDQPGVVADMEGDLGVTQSEAAEWLIVNHKWRVALNDELNYPEQRLETVRWTILMELMMPGRMVH